VTPFSNLKFVKKISSHVGAILSVKDEDQVKEVGTREQPPTSELCFKVVNSEKKQIDTS